MPARSLLVVQIGSGVQAAWVRQIDSVCGAAGFGRRCASSPRTEVRRPRCRL